MNDLTTDLPPVLTSDPTTNPTTNPATRSNPVPVRHYRPVQRRLVGWLLVASGIVLILGALRIFSAYVVAIIDPRFYLRWETLIDARVDFDWVADAVLAPALILMVVWLTRRVFVRAVLILIIAILLSHAYVALFLWRSATGDLILTISYCIAALAYLAVIALLSRGTLVSLSTNVFLRASFLMLAIGEIFALLLVLYSASNHLPFQQVDGNGSEVGFLAAVIVEWIFVVFDVIVAVTQMAAGVAIIRSGRAAVETRVPAQASATANQ